MTRLHGLVMYFERGELRIVLTILVHCPVPSCFCTSWGQSQQDLKSGTFHQLLYRAEEASRMRDET